MDNKKLIEALLAKAKALDEKATPGPWVWEIKTRIHDCKLMTAHSGQYYVMDFERWGMQDACPRLQVYERYSGPVIERGSKGMERADKMARSYPGKEHHRGFDDYIDHPDAVFIAEARALVPELISALETMTAQLGSKDKQLAAAVEDIKIVASGRCCQICSRDCIGQDEISACTAFEWRGPQEAGEGGG